jgi:flagellar biosynthesis protein FliQ
MALVPKIAVICGVLTLAGPFMLSTLNDYARMMFDRLISVGAG